MGMPDVMPQMLPDYGAQYSTGMCWSCRALHSTMERYNECVQELLGADLELWAQFRAWATIRHVTPAELLTAAMREWLERQEVAFSGLSAANGRGTDT